MWFLIQVISVAVLTAFSIAPWNVKSHLRINGHHHDIWHFAAFFAAALLFSTLPENGEERRKSTSLLLEQNALRLAAIALIAGASEAVEVIVYHNRFEWHDVAVDWAGIAGAFGCLLVWECLRALEELRRYGAGADGGRLVGPRELESLTSTVSR